MLSASATKWSVLGLGRRKGPVRLMSWAMTLSRRGTPAGAGGKGRPAHARRHPPATRRPEMEVLDEEQVRIFLGEAKRSSRYCSLHLMAVLTGMREGELLGLRWKDVDLTLGVASIQQTFYRLRGRGLLKPAKSA